VKAIPPILVRAAAGFLLLLASCDIFETRTPEKPSQGGSTFVPATSPDQVLANLKNAIAERNTQNYLRSFVDSLSSPRSFEFVPTSSAYARWPSVFSRWSLSAERTWFENAATLVPQSASSSLSLSGAFQYLGSDSAQYSADYLLVIPHGLESIPQSVLGNLQLFLATDRNKIWSIYRWIDTGFNSDPSWSDVKARFAN
jgi:hypothetical protein